MRASPTAALAKPLICLMKLKSADPLPFCPFAVPGLLVAPAVAAEVIGIDLTMVAACGTIPNDRGASRGAKTQIPRKALETKDLERRVWNSNPRYGYPCPELRVADQRQGHTGPRRQVRVSARAARLPGKQHHYRQQIFANAGLYFRNWFHLGGANCTGSAS